MSIDAVRKVTVYAEPYPRSRFTDDNFDALAEDLGNPPDALAVGLHQVNGIICVTYFDDIDPNEAATEIAKVFVRLGIEAAVIYGRVEFDVTKF